MYTKLCGNTAHSCLEQDTSVKLFAYNGTEIKRLGKCSLLLHHKGKDIKVDFFVVETGPAILGLQASCELGLITVNCSIHKMTTGDDKKTVDCDTSPMTNFDNDTDYYLTEKEKHESLKAKKQMFDEYHDLF